MIKPIMELGRHVLKMVFTYTVVGVGSIALILGMLFAAWWIANLYVVMTPPNLPTAVEAAKQ